MQAVSIATLYIGNKNHLIHDGFILTNYRMGIGTQLKSEASRFPDNGLYGPGGQPTPAFKTSFVMPIDPPVVVACVSLTYCVE